ncbi:MAG: hypothetical protein ACRCXH_08610 [Shewanella sp.]
MKQINLVLAVLGLGLSTWAHADEATQWHYSLGIHDFVVNDEHSHTFGGNASLIIEHRTPSAILLSAFLDAYVDVDIDKLDPDHIPLWFKSDYAAIGELYRSTPSLTFGWQVDLQGKRNTVSSVEKQLKFFPALTANYQSGQLLTQLKMGAGYYFLEIDDDVPKTFGYKRSDYGNSEFAYTLMGKMGGAITPTLSLHGAIQTWHDGNVWLEHQYRFELTYQNDFWVKGSQWALTAEHTQYHLDHYTKTEVGSPTEPILPWNDDTLLRLSLIVPW